MNLTKKVVVTVAILFFSFFFCSDLASAHDYGSAKDNFGMTKSRVDCIDRWRPFLEKMSKKTLAKDGKNGIDWKCPMAQIIYEGTEDRSALAINKNNNMGIDAYSTASESVYEHARTFSSKEACVKYYYDFVMRLYEEATYYPEDPYMFMSCMAEKYAPGSSDYKTDTQMIVDQIALYSAACDQKKIDEAKQELSEIINQRKEGERMVRLREEEYERAFKPPTVTPAVGTFIPKRPIEDSAVVSLYSAFRNPLEDPLGPELKKELNISKSTLIRLEGREIRAKKKLKRARKRAKNSFHTLALGVKYGRFDTGESRREMFGESYDAIMVEYEKIS